MNAIRKILVPTDFSAHSDEAFLAANTLAKATGAAVVVFHVSHAPAVASEGGALLTRTGDGKMADVWECFKKLPPADPAVRVEHVTVVAERPSAGHVLEGLEKAGCDLIVMGTHGHSWLRERLFGSLTEEVVRLAHCPVMVVKAPAHKALAAPPTVAPKAQASPPRKP